jgi:hypothetical protein
MLSRLTVATLLFLTNFPAKADWQFTKWGMTPGQVVAASRGSAVRLPPDRIQAETTFTDTRCLVQTPSGFQIAGINFMKVNYCFDGAERLQSVLLYAPEGMFYEAERALASAFGAPVQSKDGIIPERIYNDRSKGNTVRLLRVSSTVVQYRPIVSGF